MNAGIRVIATIEVHPGRRDEFLAEFRRIVPLVHAEQGCLEYEPMVDAASGLVAQGPPRADVVTVVEKWTDLAALQAHLAARHMLEYRSRVKEMVVCTMLAVLEPAPQSDPVA